MFRPLQRLVAGACVIVSFLVLQQSSGTVLEVGWAAPTDLLSPVDVQIAPALRPDAIVTRDGQLLPAIVRIDLEAAEVAERTLNEDFVRARQEFRSSVEAAFGAPTIGEDKIASLRFQSFRSEFVAAHPEFPVGYVLAATWARGDDGELVRLRMAGVLRQLMRRQLVGALPSASTVFVVELPRGTVVRSWSEAASGMVRAVDRASVITLEVARAELWRNLGVGERFAGGYLEMLLQENVRFDARLTALFLHEQLGPQLEGRFFGRGDILARAGEPIDVFAAEAMRELERLGMAPLTPVSPRIEPGPASVGVEPAPVDPASITPAATPARAPVEGALPAPPVVAPERPVLPTAWVVAMVLGCLLSLVSGAWVYVNLRRLRRAALGVPGTGGVAADPALRDVLAPHLAREMTRQGMTALFDQRQELLKTTEVATERMASMETRVAQVQPALQERMQGYERRIKALERELQEK